MNRHTFDVAILGAGTAGLSARREVEKVTDNYVVIDAGTLGTTCARVGCMPSKVLIEVANRYHARHQMVDIGITNSEVLQLDPPAVMRHVRKLRDRFVRSVMGGIDAWRETHLLREYASFVDPHTLQVGDRQIRANSIIIATGSRPILPKAWRPVQDLLIDTNRFFELETIPQKMVVIGLGVIGLELGQALHRLGVEVTAVGLGTALGALSDPEIQGYALEAFRAEFPIVTTGVKQLERHGDQLRVHTDEGVFEVDAGLLAIGRRPNLDRLGLDTIGLELDDKGIPLYSKHTQAIQGQPHLFIAGDANAERPLLHEAADQGRIAGYNAVHHPHQCFVKRTMLAVTFSEPGIALVGQRYADLVAAGTDFVTGAVSFEGQGRAIVKLQEKGLLHVYVHRTSGMLLGAEIFAPQAEHLAHLLAWAIERQVDIWGALAFPFYHPVLEEGLRTALRAAAEQVAQRPPELELMRCGDLF